MKLLKCGNPGCDKDLMKGPTVHQYTAIPVPPRQTAPEWMGGRRAHAPGAESGLFCSKACLVEDITRG